MKKLKNISIQPLNLPFSQPTIHYAGKFVLKPVMNSYFRRLKSLSFKIRQKSSSSEQQTSRQVKSIPLLFLKKNGNQQQSIIDESTIQQFSNNSLSLSSNQQSFKAHKNKQTLKNCHKLPKNTIKKNLFQQKRLITENCSQKYSDDQLKQVKFMHLQNSSQKYIFANPSSSCIKYKQALSKRFRIRQQIHGTQIKVTQMQISSNFLS